MTLKSTEEERTILHRDARSVVQRFPLVVEWRQRMEDTHRDYIQGFKETKRGVNDFSGPSEVHMTATSRLSESKTRSTLTSF
jgi:hypothetical protein